MAWRKLAGEVDGEAAMTGDVFNMVCGAWLRLLLGGASGGGVTGNERWQDEEKNGIVDEGNRGADGTLNGGNRTTSSDRAMREPSSNSTTSGRCRCQSIRLLGRPSWLRVACLCCEVADVQ